MIELRDNALFVSAANPMMTRTALSASRHQPPAAFERRFTLDDHVRVSGAPSENGMLHIDPECAKCPKRLKTPPIEIARSEPPQTEH